MHGFKLVKRYALLHRLVYFCRAYDACLYLRSDFSYGSEELISAFRGKKLGVANPYAGEPMLISLCYRNYGYDKRPDEGTATRFVAPADYYANTCDYIDFLSITM